jgi:hypothetical protein
MYRIAAAVSAVASLASIATADADAGHPEVSVERAPCAARASLILKFL